MVAAATPAAMAHCARRLLVRSGLPMPIHTPSASDVTNLRRFRGNAAPNVPRPRDGRQRDIESGGTFRPDHAPSRCRRRGLWPDSHAFVRASLVYFPVWNGPTAPGVLRDCWSPTRSDRTEIG